MSTTVAYWWCPNCKAEIVAERVTYEDYHDQCGHRVQWIEGVEVTRAEAAEGVVRLLVARLQRTPRADYEPETQAALAAAAALGLDKEAVA